MAFGYLREKEVENRSNYPQLIKYLVLIYSNQQDKFDPAATYEELQIDGNTLIDTKNDGILYDGHVSYLMNVVSYWKHIWKFKYNTKSNDGCDSQIGVWKTTSADPELDAYWIDNTTNDDKCTGYAISINGSKTNPQSIDYWSDDKFTPRIKSGDIIEMILDLKKLTLIFKINNEIKVTFTDIENTSYRAAVLIERGIQSFTLLSYQDI